MYFLHHDFACPCSHDCNATWLKTSWSKCELIYLPVKHKSNFSVFLFSLKAKPCGSFPRVRIKTISHVSQTHFPIPCSWRLAPHKWLLSISVYESNGKTDVWISLRHSGPNTHPFSCPSVIPLLSTSCPRWGLWSCSNNWTSNTVFWHLLKIPNA